jgi:transposase
MEALCRPFSAGAEDAESWHATYPFLKVVNTLLYVLITGCRWGDLPRGPQWASENAAHRWLQRWQADGMLAAMQARLLGLAEERRMIQWQYGAVGGSFSPGKGGGEGVAHGRKGKGILIHSLTDATGMPLSTRTTPANDDERAQVLPLLDTLDVRTGKQGRPRKRLKVLAADKGYDAKDLHRRLRIRGIRPQIPKRVRNNRKPRGRPIKKDVLRYQAERTCAWFQRQYRRLVVRWERLAVCCNAFLALP